MQRKSKGVRAMLNKLAKEVHQNAVEHGWWEQERHIGSLLMLMVSELSEALEEYRNGYFPAEVYYSCGLKIDDFINKCPEKGLDACRNTCGNGKPEGIPVELADCIIRILDYCGKENIDIDEAIRIKHEYNKTRPYRHGGKVI
jgi:NTP pyrophosphatase (non-canonical NTP hydrolase)